MIICVNCRGNNPLNDYKERDTARIKGLNKIRCNCCGDIIRGRFWVKSDPARPYNIRRQLTRGTA